MSVTYGFYNALDHDRLYNALQVSQIFDGLIGNGVYETIGGALMVRANTGMTVHVLTGRAWFNHTWTLNDAILPITLEDSDLIVSRYDAVVLKVDARKSVRVNSIEVIKGTPSSAPEKPDLTPENDEVYIYPLAYIYIPEGISELTQANIENCVGTSACPFVTGIIETMSIDYLVGQWKAQWEEWLDKNKADFTDYADQIESDMNEWKDEFVSVNNAWSAQQKQWFEDWFKTVQYVMDRDVAGHLQNEIDEMTFRIDKMGELYIDSDGYISYDYSNVKRRD